MDYSFPKYTIAIANTNYHSEVNNSYCRSNHRKWTNDSVWWGLNIVYTIQSEEFLIPVSKEGSMNESSERRGLGLRAMRVQWRRERKWLWLSCSLACKSIKIMFFQQELFNEKLSNTDKLRHSISFLHAQSASKKRYE